VNPIHSLTVKSRYEEFKTKYQIYYTLTWPAEATWLPKQQLGHLEIGGEEEDNQGLLWLCYATKSYIPRYYVHDQVCHEYITCV
jgi:hypothetical protein